MSSNMARSDSAQDSESQTPIVKAPPMALQITPNNNQQQNDHSLPGGNGFSPWIDAFTPGQIAPAQSSGPTSAMSFLNVDSVPDQSGDGVSATQPSSVMPIGSGFVRSAFRDRVSTHELSEGPPFTTSGDASSSITRFVRLGGIPEHWVEDGMLERALHHCGFEAELAAPYFVTHGDTVGTIFVFMMFDDLRVAMMSRETFSVVLTTATFTFIDGWSFYELFTSSPRAHALSPYDGQISFITNIAASLREVDLLAIYQQIRDFASNFGEIRSFAYVQTNGFAPPHFRAEFFSLAAAERAAGLFEIKDGIPVSDSITVTIKEYTPERFHRYPHPALANGLVVTEDDRFFEDYVITPRYGAFHGRRNDTYDNGHRQIRGGRGGRSGRGRGRGGRGGFRHNNRAFYANDHDEPFDFWSTQPDSIVHRLDMSLHVHNQPQTVNLQKIHAGVDVRTTVMLRNIPNRTQFEDLKEWLDETSFGHYDFSYLRIDFSNNCNVGYAFVDFVRPEFIIEFVNARVGKPWKLFNSQKRCEVSYATIQGIDCLLAKFRNSVVMEEYSAFRPKLWYHVDSTDIPEGLMIGDEAPFPPPDNEQKRRRSRDNATTVGLFPPRHGRGPHGGSHRDGQFDRGTTFALREERLLEQQRQLRLEDRRVAALLCEHDQSQHPVDFIQDTRARQHAPVHRQGHFAGHSQDARLTDRNDASAAFARLSIGGHSNGNRRGRGRYANSQSSNETVHADQGHGHVGFYSLDHLYQNGDAHGGHQHNDRDPTHGSHFHGRDTRR